MKLEATNLSYTVGGRVLLQDISLCLDDGSRTLLLGPNGSGKSTLMSLLAGARKPDRGEVRLNSVPLGGTSLGFRSRKIGVLTQSVELAFPFQVREVVEMGRIPHGDLRFVTDGIVDDLLALLDLDGERVYTTLSGGEKQLVQIARVLAQVWTEAPEAILLLDEPTAPLDLRHQRMVFDVLGYLNRKGVTQVIVMHDVNLAADYMNRVALMADGRVLASGKPAVVLSAPNLEKTFGIPMRQFEDSGSGARFFSALRRP